MHKQAFSPVAYLFFALLLIAAMLLCICMGSVAIPLSDTLTALRCTLFRLPFPTGIAGKIIVNVRLPRVLAVALTGAALSLCGAGMQGLLRNPLADGSTLGVSAGASLGAVIALMTGFTLPGLPLSGTAVLAMVSALCSLLAILSLSYALDRSLATNSIILIGVIFSMFVSSLITLLIAFSGEKLRSITFWTMGSLAGVSTAQIKLLAVSLAIGTAVLLHNARELNAFAVGEDNARHIGVNVRRVKLTVLVTVSALIGVCVSVAGTISFVGLVMPHMMRMLFGPNHRRLLPASLFGGAIFLLLCDLTARTLLSPIELPIGVVTSLIGAAAFIFIFRSTSKKG